ncbi:MAG: hypothetical protein HY343_08105 [Lentisphaerae bacterium]|nr:hypothetical protein [Lentisphaerota bacterium]
MKVTALLMDTCVAVAGVSLIVGLISRVMVAPFAYGLEARSFLGFSMVCLLFAITLGLRELIKKP